MVKIISCNDLTEKQEELLFAAQQVCENAYNPYSKFYVGASLRSLEGEIFTGANYENCAYGSTTCAERSALHHANAHGVRTFSSLAIITRGENFDCENPSAPCGACRQNLYEASQLSGFDLEIILSNTRKDIIYLTSVKELLPLAFGPLDIGVDISNYIK